MFKQAITKISVFTLIIILIQSFGFSECGRHINKNNSSKIDLSNLSSDEIYQLYVENVEMNNPYIHQINLLGSKNWPTSSSTYLVEFNLTDLEMFEMAQEESYKLFQEWLNDENTQKEFIKKMNTRISTDKYHLVTKDFQ